VEFEALRPVVVTLLYFVSVYSLFDAMAVVFGSAVRGAGDTRFSLVFTAIVVWLVMVLPVWWIWRQGGGLYACWGAVCAQITVLGIGFWLRFLGGKWLTMRVIEPHVVETDPAASLDTAA
jgi:MATE family multidrug resistance protein